MASRANAWDAASYDPNPNPNPMRGTQLVTTPTLNQFRWGAGRVRGPGQIGMLVSICKGKGLLGIRGQEVEDKGETV